MTEGGQTYRAALNVIDIFEHGSRRDAAICAQSAGFCADHFAGRAATLDTHVSYKLLELALKLPYYLTGMKAVTRAYLPHETGFHPEVQKYARTLR